MVRFGYVFHIIYSIVGNHQRIYIKNALDNVFNYCIEMEYKKLKWMLSRLVRS